MGSTPGAETVDNLLGGVAGVSIGEILEFVNLETIFSEDKLIQEALASLEEKIKKEEAFFAEYDDMYNVFDASSSAYRLFGDETEFIKVGREFEPEDTRMIGIREVRILDDTQKEIPPKSREYISQLINNFSEKHKVNLGVLIRVVEDCVGEVGLQLLREDIVRFHSWHHTRAYLSSYGFFVLIGVVKNNDLVGFWIETENLPLEDKLFDAIRNSSHKEGIGSRIEYVIERYVGTLDNYFEEKVSSPEGSFGELVRYMREGDYENASYYCYGELANLLQLVINGKELEQELARNTIYTFLDFPSYEYEMIETERLDDENTLVLVEYQDDIQVREVFLYQKEKEHWKFDSYLLLRARQRLNTLLLDLEQDIQSFPFAKYLSTPENSWWLIADIFNLSTIGVLNLGKAKDLLSRCSLDDDLLMQLSEVKKEYEDDISEIDEGVYYEKTMLPRKHGGKVFAKTAMVRNRKFKYIYCPDDINELYDLEGDPQELHNLAGKPEVRSIEQTLRDEILPWLLRTGDSVPYKWDQRKF